MILTTPALVLRTVDYGEADRIVTLLSRTHGKLSALARSARKSRRRFGAGLSLFGVGEATLKERAHGDLYLLESFDSRRGFPGIATDVAKVAHAGYAAELGRELSPPRDADPRLFDLLVELFTHLDEHPARAETLRIFELKLLDAVGLTPELERCLGCGLLAPDDAGQVFDVRRGGLVCGACGGHGQALSLGLRQTMLSLRRTELTKAPLVSLEAEHNRGAREIIAEVLRDHLGRPLKSLEFIAKLNHAQSSDALHSTSPRSVDR
jgi:DNA repair protein RecO (recombination protein O)